MRWRRSSKASRARIADLEARVDIDPLTDVLNRRGFERELKRSLAYVKRYGTSAALIYVDLDGFKPVNDRHGHAAGDAVLKAIAAALFAMCAPPTSWRASAATNSPCCCGTSAVPPRPPRPRRSKPRSIRRRCAGAPRPSSSAPPRASRCSGALDSSGRGARARRCGDVRAQGRTEPLITQAANGSGRSPAR